MVVVVVGAEEVEEVEGFKGVHSFFGVENCPKKTASSQNTKDLKNLVRLGSD